MLFEDNGGNLLVPDEVDELSPYEIEERGIHVFDEEDRWLESQISKEGIKALIAQQVLEGNGERIRTMISVINTKGADVPPGLIIGQQKA